jgi:hypothetical protein
MVHQPWGDEESGAKFVGVALDVDAWAGEDTCPYAIYVMLTSVYVPYTSRSASQISPTVA